MHAQREHLDAIFMEVDGMRKKWQKAILATIEANRGAGRGGATVEPPSAPTMVGQATVTLKQYMGRAEFQTALVKMAVNACVLSGELRGVSNARPSHASLLYTHPQVRVER